MSNRRDFTNKNTIFTGTEGIVIPAGSNAERSVSPSLGTLRYNTNTGLNEQYNSSGWQAIDSPPVVTSISPSTELASDTTQEIVITGSNFSNVVTVKLIGTNLLEYTPTTVTRNSNSQVTITFTGSDRLSGTYEPYAVKVTNSSGLSYTLESALNINDIPTWVTAAGSLATVYEDITMTPVTVSATDPEGAGITYSITSGALPTGLTLNSSTGQISGTPDVNDSVTSGGVTHNFAIGASDGQNATQIRSFSILRLWVDGSTSALAAPSAYAIRSLGVTTNGYYWIKPTGTSTAYQVHCDMTNNGGGWMLMSFCGTGISNGAHVEDSYTGSAFNMGNTSTAINSTNQSSGTAGNMGQSFIDALVQNGRSRGVAVFRIENAGDTWKNWYFTVDSNARWYPLNTRKGDNDGGSGNNWLKSCKDGFTTDSGNNGAGTPSGSTVGYGGENWGTFPFNMNVGLSDNWGYSISPTYGGGGYSTYNSSHSSGWNRRASFWLKIV